jgi:hypothetical protein
MNGVKGSEYLTFSTYVWSSDILAVAPSNYLMALGDMSNTTPVVSAPKEDAYLYKAEALHACKIPADLPFSSTDTLTDTGSSEDLTELSFRKGEVLEILTKSDLWWEAKNSDGRKGSKNFSSFIDEYMCLIFSL